MGLEFHVFTINRSTHTKKKVCKLIVCNSNVSVRFLSERAMVNLNFNQIEARVIGLT